MASPPHAVFAAPCKEFHEFVQKAGGNLSGRSAGSGVRNDHPPRCIIAGCQDRPGVPATVFVLGGQCFGTSELLMRLPWHGIGLPL